VSRYSAARCHRGDQNLEFKNRLPVRVAPYVRFGSKADFAPCLDYVRFAPESGHRAPRLACQLCARTGL